MGAITFFGAAGMVTGSRYLLEHEGRRVLLDCGLFQGERALRRLNWEQFPVDVRTQDSVVLTHAHVEPSGGLPRLVAQGCRGPIHATPGTRGWRFLRGEESVKIHGTWVKVAAQVRKISGRHPGPRWQPAGGRCTYPRSTKPCHSSQLRESRADQGWAGAAAGAVRTGPCVRSYAWIARSMTALSNAGRRNCVGGGASVGRPRTGASAGACGDAVWATEASGLPWRALQDRDARDSTAAKVIRAMRSVHSTRPHVQRSLR
jgi:hypothetical protein